nr:protein piccolo-like [Aedes albopictus]
MRPDETLYIKQKVNVANNFIRRVQTFSTNVDTATTRDIITTQLKLNDYPTTMINRLIDRSRERQVNPTNEDVTDSEETIYRSMVQVGQLSGNIQKILKKDYPNVTISSKNAKTVGNMLPPVKDVEDKNSRSNEILTSQKCALVHFSEDDPSSWRGQHIKISFTPGTMSDPGMDAAKKTKGKQQKSPPSIRSVNKEPPKDPSKQTQNKASKSDIVAISTSKPLNPPKSDPQATISAEKSCALCENPVNERMVQCNTCDVWHHFSCVGVSEDIKGYNWTCLKCDTAKAAKGAIPRKMMTRAAAAKGTKKANRKEGQIDGVNEQTKEADELAGAVGGPAPSLKASRAGSVVSAASRKSAKARLDVELQQIKAEEELMREEMQRKRELAKKKFEVLKEMADLEGSGESAVDQPNVVNKVEHWLKRHSEIREKDKQSYKEARDYDSEDCVETEASSEISASGSESDSDEETSTDSGADRDGRADGAQSVGELVGRRHLRPKMTSTRKVPKGGSSNRSGTERQQSLRSDRKLSKDELAARQVVPRELPKFSGNPEEWPMFVSTYARLVQTMDDSGILPLDAIYFCI